MEVGARNKNEKKKKPNEKEEKGEYRIKTSFIYLILFIVPTSLWNVTFIIFFVEN